MLGFPRLDRMKQNFFLGRALKWAFFPARPISHGNSEKLKGKEGGNKKTGMKGGEDNRLSIGDGNKVRNSSPVTFIFSSRPPFSPSKMRLKASK